MEKERISIASIPGIIWGLRSEKVYIFVHGKLSNKEEAEDFATIATEKGYQVISFDLPEHGERKETGYACTVQNGVHDLLEIKKFADANWKDISLFGCSIGAYFSLVAYREDTFSKCLFLSPVLDMERLITNMMKWCNVTEKQLEEEQEIETPMGETLSWPYYTFVKQNPVDRWNSPTAILLGENDHLLERDVVENFTRTFHCSLEVVPNAEHYFHTSEQVECLRTWLMKNI